MIGEAGSWSHDEMLDFVYRGPLSRNANKVRMTAGHFLM